MQFMQKNALQLIGAELAKLWTKSVARFFRSF